MSAAFAKPCIVLREKLKREERCEIRFTSAGKPRTQIPAYSEKEHVN